MQLIEARGHLLLDAYKALGLDAMAVGERDTEAKMDLRRLPHEALVTRAGIRVGVFSVDLGMVESDVAPLAATLSQKSAQLRKKGAKLVIALLHGPDARAQKTLEAATGIDVAVLAHDVMYATGVRHFGNTWVVESPPQGKQAGILDLHIVGGKLAFADVGQRAQMEVNMADFTRQLTDIDTREKTSDAKLRPMYEQQKQQITQLRESTRQQLANTPKIQGSWLEARAIPLGTDIPDDPRIAQLVTKYKADIAKLMPAPPITTGITTGLTTTGMPVNTAGAPYAGVATCATCHAPAVAFWKTTKHARAWKTLVDQQQDKNPACITCHITGAQLTLPDVQCEACHGPAANHARMPGVRGMVRREAPESACVVCHTPNQGAFEYKSFRAAILGKGHGGH